MAQDTPFSIDGALLRETNFRWQIENEKDIQFVSMILRAHKNIHTVKMYFCGEIADSQWEQLAFAIQSSQIQKMFLSKSVESMDLSVLIRALRYINSLERLQMHFEPQSSEIEAIVSALQNPHLRKFFVEHIDDLWQSAAPILSTHKTLRKLGICSIKNSYQHVYQILSENKILETLVLTPDDDFTADEMTHLISALKNNTTLKSLKIVQGEDEHIPMLCEALAYNQIHISALHFSVDDVSENTVKALSRSLRTNTALTSLVLCGTVAECQDFGEALKHNSTLKMLNIRAGDPLSIRALEMICTALKCQPCSLTCLALTNCEQFGPIVDMLVHNNTLKSLALRSLKLDDESLTHICAALVKNNTLTELDVDRPYGTAGLKSVSDMLKKNNSLRKLTVKPLAGWGIGIICEGLVMNTSVTHVIFASHIEDFQHAEGRLSALLEHNYALTSISPENDRMPKVSALLTRNRQLVSEARFKVVILSHNIARSHEAMEMLPREIWIQILSLVTHPGVEPFAAFVENIFNRYK